MSNDEKARKDWETDQRETDREERGLIGPWWLEEE